MIVRGKTLCILAGIGLLMLPVNALRAQEDGKKEKELSAKVNAELKKLQQELAQARADLEKQRAELEKKAEALLKAAQYLRQLEEKARSEKLPPAASPTAVECPLIIPIYVYPAYQNYYYYRRPSYLPQLPVIPQMPVMPGMY